MSNRKLVWLIPEQPLFGIPKRISELKLNSFPKSLSLEGSVDHVFDQLSMGSCVGQAVAMASYLCAKINHTSIPRFSALDVYRGARIAMGTVNEDSGSYIHDAIDFGFRTGLAREEDWPYDMSKFALDIPQEAKTLRAKTRIVATELISPTLNHIKWEINSHHFIVAGFRVTNQWMGGNPDGFIELPSGEVIGGHAVIILGYDDNKQAVRVLNSWGKNWGTNGLTWLHYDWLKWPWLGEIHAIRAVRSFL